MQALAGMLAGDGDLSGALVTGEADGILITHIGLAIIKVFTKEPMISATDVIGFIREQEEVSVEMVLITSIHVQESLDAVLTPTPVLLKLMKLMAEEAVPLAEVPVSTTLT